MSETGFGRYLLQELLGQGGMGQVYRAYDTDTERVVALKLLPPHATEDPVFKQRFRREAHTAAGLTDPHVVPIHRYGEIDGRLYLDMRLIEGRDLGVLLANAGGPMEPARAVRYIEQVAEALHAAHTAGLVHRDVKPSNILVTPRDFVYLIDFGIAQAANETRLTNTGNAIGTFQYMAPERFTVGESGPPSDIYALACVLYECLTAKPPFEGTNVERQIAAHLMTPPPRPSATHTTVPRSFDAVIKKGLAKEPVDRYQTALDLASAARRALDVKTPVAKKRTAAPAVKKSPASKPISPSAPTRPAPARAMKRQLPSRPRAAVVRPIDDEPEPSGDIAFWIALLVIFGVLIVIVIAIFTT